MKFVLKKPKIIILSGKARSGKNEVAKIIEEYYKDKKVISISYGYYLKEYVKKIINWDGSSYNKPRTFLQELGISLIKNKIDNKLLIRRILEDIKVFSYFYDVIIITDARLIDEIEDIKREYNNSISIRIIRGKDNLLTDKEKIHITETNLDNYDKFDYKVFNINYEKLKNDVCIILEDLK